MTISGYCLLHGAFFTSDKDPPLGGSIKSELALLNLWREVRQDCIFLVIGCPNY